MVNGDRNRVVSAINGARGSTPIAAWATMAAVFLGACSSQVKQVKTAPKADVRVEEPAYKGPKRRVAISKFEDKSGYGSNLFGTIDDLGSQASDILASHLVKTGEFIVLERENLAALEAENKLQGKENQFIGVNAMVFGSVTEFGTKTEYQDAGLSKKKVQTARAKVTIRMVDPATSVAFYSEFGEARAQKEVSQVLGFGSAAGYDATLTDQALNGAITKLVGNIISTLRSQPWEAAVLDIQEGSVIISAGQRTGIEIGQELVMVRPGKTVKNPQTGGMIQLPGEQIGRIKVVSQFGSSDLDEGSVATVLSGSGFTTQDKVQLPEGK